MSDGFELLMHTMEASGKKYNIEKITKAYEVAKQLHEGQFRKSGEAYICHPVAVAEIVAGLGLDTDSICAALFYQNPSLPPGTPAFPQKAGSALVAVSAASAGSPRKLP